MKEVRNEKKNTPSGVYSQAKSISFEIFFSRMEEIRKSRGLKSADIARFLGITNQSFQKYRKDRVPSTEYLYKISHVLGVSMNWLLGDGDILHPAYLPQDGTVAQADHEAIQKALSLISQANTVLTDYISK